MKKLLSVLLVFCGIAANAQLTGGTLLPTGKYQGFNKQAIASGKVVLDGKYSYYDTTNYVSRPFTSTTEANSFLPVTQRGLGQTVLINTGGSVNTGSSVVIGGVTYAKGEIIGGTNAEYWYRDGRTNGDLVAKNAPTLVTAVDSTDIKGAMTVFAWGTSLSVSHGGTQTNEYVLGTPWAEYFKNITGYNAISYGVSGNTSAQIRARFMADMAANPSHKYMAHVFEMVANGPGSGGNVIDDIQACIAVLQSVGNNRYLVTGLVGHSSPSYWDGTELHTGTVGFNDVMKSTFTTHYVALRDSLVASYNPAISQDVIDFGHDIPPYSLFSDIVHMNDAGYRAYARIIAAQAYMLRPTSDAKLVTTGNLLAILKNASVITTPLVNTRKVAIGMPATSDFYIDGNSQYTQMRQEIKGGSVWWHSYQNDPAVRGGIMIRDNLAAEEGYANMTITGTNQGIWGPGDGIKFKNSSKDIGIGANLTVTGYVAASGNLSGSNMQATGSIKGANFSNLGAFESVPRVAFFNNPGGSQNGGIRVPILTTAQLPGVFNAIPGEILYNSDLFRLQYTKPHFNIANGWMYMNIANTDDVDNHVPNAVAGPGISITGAGTATDKFVINNLAFPPSLKLTGTPFQSPDPSTGGPATDAFDGNIATSFRSVTSDQNPEPFVGLSLPAPANLTKIRVRQYDGESMIGSRLQGSNTTALTGYTDLYTFTTDQFFQWREIPISPDTAYKFYRIIKGISGYVLYINELELYGYIKQPPFKLTTTGTGAATFLNDTLNIPTVSGAVWGNITGTLSAQTDLQSALNAKVNISDTAAMLNNYTTLAESRAGISGTSPVTYNNVTGAISLTPNSSFRFVSDAEKATWNGKGDIAGQTWTGNHIFPTTTTGVTPSLTDSSNKFITSAFVKQFYAQNADTLNHLNTGTGKGVFKGFSADGDTAKYRSITGTAATVSFNVDSTSINIAPEVTFAGANSFTNIQSWVIAGMHTMRRTTYGEALRIEGPSGSNYITFGTHPSFQFNRIYSNARLDIEVASNMYLKANNTFAGGNFIMDRLLDATSTATQAGSGTFMQQVSLWNGSSAYQRYIGWYTRPSTTVNGRFYYDLRMGGGASGNPELADGQTAISVGNDSTFKINYLNKGGTARDSVGGYKQDGTAFKFAEAHPRTGTPTFGSISGAGTSPTVTVTGDDTGGYITITTGSSGTFGVLSGTLTFATAYGSRREVVVGGRNTGGGSMIPLATTTTGSNAIIGSVNALAASTSYQITYIVQQ